MLVQICLALRVVDLAVLDDIVIGGAVFGDQQPARAVVVMNALQDLIESRRIDLPARRGNFGAGRHDGRAWSGVAAGS